MKQYNYDDCGMVFFKISTNTDLDSVKLAINNIIKSFINIV